MILLIFLQHKTDLDYIKGCCLHLRTHTHTTPTHTGRTVTAKSKHLSALNAMRFNANNKIFCNKYTYKDSSKLIQHPMLGSIDTLQVLLWATNLKIQQNLLLKHSRKYWLDLQYEHHKNYINIDYILTTRGLTNKNACQISAQVKVVKTD